MELGLIILVGGKSSRMGRNKAWLEWQGKTFLENTLEKAWSYGFTEIIVVANEAALAQYAHLPVTLTADAYRECGPLGGLHAGLSIGAADYHLVISCDMPLLQFDFVEKLKAYADGKTMAVVPINEEYQEPLAALYHRNCLPAIVELLEQGERKLGLLLQRVATKRVAMACADTLFFNTNTPAELAIAEAKAVNAKRRIPIVSIVAGKSGTGKTTFITKLIPILQAMGIRTAIVKSDSHGFDIDHEGKDTWKFTQAGAAAVAIVSPAKYAIIAQTKEKKSLLEVAAKIEDVDLIIIESRQSGAFPVLEIQRDAVSDDALITPLRDLVAVISDKPAAASGVKNLPLAEPAKTAAFIKEIIS